tara:strand:- start:4197 stop:4559 length:363 start_codon:yes stop_codon:yes gene_type:complete
MDEKERIVNNVKTWLTIDEEIKKMQREIRNKKKEKKIVTENLVEIMKYNEIDCFDINDGKLVYTKSKVKQALSKKHLLNALSTYFQNDGIKAKEVTSFILDSRQVKIKENIKHKIKKNKK